jgi:hypothetical protein
MRDDDVLHQFDRGFSATADMNCMGWHLRAQRRAHGPGPRSTQQRGVRRSRSALPPYSYVPSSLFPGLPLWRVSAFRSAPASCRSDGLSPTATEKQETAMVRGQMRQFWARHARVFKTPSLPPWSVLLLPPPPARAGATLAAARGRGWLALRLAGTASLLREYRFNWRPPVSNIGCCQKRGFGRPRLASWRRWALAEWKWIDLLRPKSGVGRQQKGKLRGELGYRGRIS